MKCPEVERQINHCPTHLLKKKTNTSVGIFRPLTWYRVIFHCSTSKNMLRKVLFWITSRSWGHCNNTNKRTSGQPSKRLKDEVKASSFTNVTDNTIFVLELVWWIARVRIPVTKTHYNSITPLQLSKWNLRNCNIGHLTILKACEDTWN
jgi:hypothetical protein